MKTLTLYLFCLYSINQTEYKNATNPKSSQENVSIYLEKKSKLLLIVKKPLPKIVKFHWFSSMQIRTKTIKIWFVAFLKKIIWKWRSRIRQYFYKMNLIINTVLVLINDKKKYAVFVKLETITAKNTKSVISKYIVTNF